MGKYPDAYIAYLVEFHATRDYFECHELLEEYWKAHPDDGMGDTWVGLIQIAVGQYHERRGNRRGAAKMYESADGKLADEQLVQLGMDARSLRVQLEERRKAVEAGTPFKDIEIKLTDEELLRLCMQACEAGGYSWGTASPAENQALIHRHLLRDRTMVVAAREEALLKKRTNT
ncbi:DUF309 domain-containing protein [Paenibacillus sp. 1011MAR3C5]|uniref:DUF309 domain-containing protein n=1 Tax=Paenibacillus sp. 1011MAR3C5 TaxID=1675787 RepID=UPI000E6CFBD3|nr:DUF309 domain-containing protein [Paenibacillus sp. 1011MAR3C5]RJE90143.1 DUF309 domain-containing protein [Paenibacillus sp. 1011MAR3C5]